MITFEGSEEAMLAETVLKKKGLHVRFTTPPKGCGLAIEIDLNNKAIIDQILKEQDIKYEKIIEISDKKE